MELTRTHSMLFDELDADRGVLSPNRMFEMFESWLHDAPDARKLDEQVSISACRDLWKVFAAWCCVSAPGAPLAASEIDQSSLEGFLAWREEELLKRARHRNSATAPRRAVSTDDASGDGLTVRYVWRVLRLVDRVLAHDATSRGQAPNPAARRLLASRPEWQHANARHRDSLPTALPGDQAAILVQFLSGVSPRNGRSALAASMPWNDIRNVCAVATHLGCGLTPIETRSLLVSSVVDQGGPRAGVPWKLRVPQVGTSPERETPVPLWAGHVLAAWLETRARAGIAGDCLLPATRTGRPWSKVGHYLAVENVLDASGIDKSLVPGGAFRLRHTFALRQLARNRPRAKVASWLGVDDGDVMERYARIVAPTDTAE